jgi:aminopeptidase-like protein/aminoglycoside N3'-acetyltransferase
MHQIRETMVTSDAGAGHPASAYGEADLLAALRAAGLTRGDLVFVHVCLETLGPARDADSSPARGAMVLRALRDAVGETGTLILPAFTFSFCQQQPFDVERSATPGGEWGTSADVLEFVRQSPWAVRSRDPIFSVTALGPQGSRLIENLPPTCFGEDSLQHRLRRAGSKICLIGVGPHEATMVLHAEAACRVPFRFKKLFTGEITEQGKTHREGWVYDVRVQCPNTTLDADRMLREATRRGVVRSVAVGRDAVHVMDAEPFYEFLCDEIKADPWFTVKGPPIADLVAFDGQRVAAEARTNPTAPGAAGRGDRLASAAPALPIDASMEDIVRELWMVRRDIVSDGYDASLAALGTQLPLRIHEYPTGMECFTWLVPEKWTCHEAWLETLDGRRLFSYDDHPLHVVSYSLPFDGVVARDELMGHLHVHDRLPDALPFMFKYYERDWGLCCSRRLRDSLHDERYRVHIRTSFSYGTMKVGEVVAPGATDDTIVLAAHLCHPGMAMDDLSGLAVGVDVMRTLLRRTTSHPRRYTYRFLILPETIGSLAYLSDQQDLVPRMKGGLFLEMLGLDNPHALQRSFAGDTEVDACFVAALRSHDPSGWTAPYRVLLGNDERQFNAPGVRVPMLSLMRVLPRAAPDYPYREYHSSEDTPAIVSPARLRDSRDLVLRMIEALECSRVPINRFAGEVCCSRYGLHIDWFREPDAHRSMFTIMDLIDGTRSIARIADASGETADVVRQVLDRLEARGLIAYEDGGRS